MTQVVSQHEQERWAAPATPARQEHARRRDTRAQRDPVHMGAVVPRARLAWPGHPPAGTALASVASRGFTELPVSLPEGEPSPQQTTPGELLASAYATLVAAALAEELALNESPAEEIVVEVACMFASALPTRNLIALDLDVSGRVPGLDTQGFLSAVERARQRTRQSAGTRENLPICLRAQLEPCS